MINPSLLDIQNEWEKLTGQPMAGDMITAIAVAMNSAWHRFSFDQERKVDIDNRTFTCLDRVRANRYGDQLYVWVEGDIG